MKYPLCKKFMTCPKIDNAAKVISPKRMKAFDDACDNCTEYEPGAFKQLKKKGLASKHEKPQS
jgi:hypothetical protein